MIADVWYAVVASREDAAISAHDMDAEGTFLFLSGGASTMLLCNPVDMVGVSAYANFCKEDLARIASAHDSNLD